jgi:Ca2+/Na+ antiporter
LSGTISLLQLIHAVVAIIGAIVAFRVIRRSGRGFPRYIHYLAVLAFLIAASLIWTAPRDAPVRRANLGGLPLWALVLLFPAFVYVFFLVYGAHHVMDRQRRADDSSRCRHCGGWLGSIREMNILKRAKGEALMTRCPRCGETIV